MEQREARKTDRAAMAAILRENRATAAGMILRLAWNQGLTREELCNLRWDEADFEAGCLRTAGRTIPFEGDTEAALREWKLLYGAYSDKIIISERLKKPMAPESASRLARQTLDAAGQTELRLADLRRDYIERQLEQHDWPYVLQVSGLSVTTYRNNLGGAGRTPTEEPKPPRDAGDEAFRLWTVMNRDQDSPAVIALWLSYQLGLRSEEIVALTWAQVDFEGGCIRLEDRQVKLSSAAARILKAELLRRRPEDDPHVILTPRTRKPMSSYRLSALVRTALIRGGLSEASLRTLRRDNGQEEEKYRICAYIREHGSITRSECVALLQTTENRAYARLNALTEAGELTRINSRYYAADRVIPPERQAEAIRRYLEENGTAYCQDIAALLHIGKRSTARLLKQMAERGELRLLQREKRYILPEKIED